MKTNNYKWTFNEVLERFESIEKKLCLDKSLIQSVPWWDMLRYKLFKELLVELGCRDKKDKKIDPTIMRSAIIKILTTIHIFKNFIKFFMPRSPLWMSKRNNVILGHPRRKLEASVYVDPYTDPFIDLFPSSINFSVIERQDFNGHLSPAKTKNLFYADSLYNFASIISKFRRLEFSQDDFLILSRLEKSLYDEFSCKVDIHKRVRKIIKKWLGMYPLMRLFFKLKKPRLLFIVVSAGQEAIIAAAKSLGISTLELQHGTPSRGKLNYDYTSGIKKMSFPDFFLSFGDYWPPDCKLPLDEKKIVSFGNSYLYNKISLYSHIAKEDRLVVVSQSDLTSDLSKFAQEISKQFSKKIIIEYKPHPYEFNGPEPKYFEQLRDAGVIISDKNADIYEIFARSRWQVGVFSTALYEGLYFEVACFVLKINGSEHMKKLIELDLARLISSSKDIDLNFKVDDSKIKKIFSCPGQESIDFIRSLNK